MRFILEFALVLAYAQTSLQECKVEWEKIIDAGADILSPKPSDYAKMFSYSGFTINNLGQYDSCLDISIAKFAVIDISFLPAIAISLCGPKVCSEEDYNILLSNLTGTNPLSVLVKYQNPMFILELNKIHSAQVGVPVIFPKEFYDDHFKD